MPHERFFIDQPLMSGKRISLRDAEFHHLCHVMRAHVGDPIELVNGKHQLAHASVAQITKKEVQLILSHVHTEESLSPRVILAQAIPRFNRLEYILEKSVELNVSEIWLFPSLLSEKTVFSDNQSTRMSQVCIAAMKQCGRLDLPPIKIHPPLLQWKPLEGQVLFGDTASDAPLLKQLPQVLFPITFFIGPEKGFPPQEVLFLKQTLKAQGVRLHQHILRVDTAPLAALSQLFLFY